MTADRAKLIIDILLRLVPHQYTNGTLVLEHSDIAILLFDVIRNDDGNKIRDFCFLEVYCAKI